MSMITCGREVLTDKEIVARVKATNTCSDDDAEDGEEAEVIQKPPSLREAFQAVDVIRRFNFTSDCPEEFNTFIDRYETFLMRELPKYHQQILITDFLR